MSFAQLACGGEWERAVRLDRLASSGGDLERLEEWRASAGDFAVEMFFAADDATPLLAEFIGVRVRGDAGAAVLHSLVEVTRSPSSALATPASFVALLEQRFGWTLFRGRWEHAEVGVVNAWRSSERFRWTEERSAAALLSAMELNAPMLLEATVNPVAVEWTHLDPIEHWRGIPVSRQQGDRFCLDATLFAGAIRGHG